jgi:hypothetical protein
MRFYTLILLALIPLVSNAQVEGQYDVTVKKHEEKKNARWTLQEWLAQKDRNRMMDLWLAQNSHHSPFEFFLEGRSLNYNLENADGSHLNYNTYNGMFAAYAGLAGLRGGYEGDQETRTKWSGSFNLRILGRALQDTHVNIEYGIQGLTEKDSNSDAQKYQNQFGGVEVDFYLTKYFGLDGTYHKILPGNSNLDREMDGESEKAGVFIDFGPYRLFGEWQREYLRFRDGGLPDLTEIREGFGGGIRIFF